MREITLFLGFIVTIHMFLDLVFSFFVYYYFCIAFLAPARFLHLRYIAVFGLFVRFIVIC